MIILSSDSRWGQDEDLIDDSLCIPPDTVHWNCTQLLRVKRYGKLYLHEWCVACSKVSETRSITWNTVLYDITHTLNLHQLYINHLTIIGCQKRMLGPNKSFMGTSNLVSGGVIQRVDGSEAEKKAVKTVMQKMHDYFINEVYSKAVYEPFLPRWWVDVLSFFVEAILTNTNTHLYSVSLIHSQNKNEL